MKSQDKECLHYAIEEMRSVYNPFIVLGVIKKVHVLILAKMNMAWWKDMKAIAREILSQHFSKTWYKQNP